MKHRIPAILLTATLSTSLLSACVKNPEARGYVTEYSAFDQIQVGATTKEETYELLGSPSSTSAYGDETWLYIGTKLERVAFLNPDIVEHNVVKVVFDDNGIVKQFDDGVGERRRDIAVTNDETKTEGNSIGVLEQLLGNLGKFNANE